MWEADPDSFFFSLDSVCGLEIRKCRRITSVRHGPYCALNVITTLSFRVDASPEYILGALCTSPWKCESNSTAS